MRTVVRAAAIVAVMAAAPGMAQRPSQGLVLTDADAGQVVKLPPMAEFQVRLPQQAGTAYRWQLRRDPRIELAGPLVTENAGPGGMVGARQYRVFSLRATRAGRIPLTFALRAITGDQPPARQVTITLDVDGPDTIDPSEGRPDMSDARGIGTDAAPLQEGDAYRVIDVAAGQPVTIALQSNATTGYSWRLISARNAGLAAPIAERPDPNPRGMVGVGGTSIVRVRFNQRGPAEIVLGYVPPARGAVAERQLRFRFRVK